VNIVPDPIEGQPEQHCSHYTHLMDVQRGLNICVTCRKKLYSRPRTWCAAHSLYLCPECFDAEQIEKFIFENGMTT